MADVVCMGELLVDFVPTQAGVSLADAPGFKKAAGGAPANVAVGLARLGVKSEFMGQVGDDEFGRFLARTLNDNGVGTESLVFSAAAQTGLAFVSLGAQGERDFMFYRHPSADMLFEPAAVNVEAIRQARAFHFGSISLISEPSRSATMRALDAAAGSGRLISFDPNLRPALWPEEADARAGLALGWQRAQIIKAAAEEVVFLSGQADIGRGVARLWHPDLQLVAVTEGAAGCRYFTPGGEGRVPGFAVQAVDTTGAGDGFTAAMLAGLLARPDDWPERVVLEQVLRVANAAGALTTTRRGAIPALPDRAAVEALVAATR
ncbi:MAG: PfkB family carbohydrate kinase [Anaerolineae bacterium]